MTYRAPIDDMLIALNHGAGLQAAVTAGHYGDYDSEITAAILDEAGKFATDVLAPLNKTGDESGIKLADDKVTTAPGWPDAYKRWAAAGWNAVSGPEQFGGQGLPLAINAVCTEIWSASNMAFGLCPLLTLGATEALAAHGSDALKAIYLEKMVSGEWTGTMQLTEPQAGSDVGALRSRAERAADGTYRISGTKIFITYGDHDMTDNIVHFVLARLPDAPPGTRGISLFLVPKFLVNADGSLGARNDIYPSGVEHKLGIHASPTCTMTMGDKGGAVGYLIGEENRGMQCMFTMMNQARLGVGLEGVGIADRAYQQALAYAQERKQGKGVGATGAGPDPIIVHPDVKRMLLQMRAMAAAARTICYATAVALDVAARAKDPAVRAAAAARGALLTPTRLYVKSCLRAIRETGAVKGLAHITGGGFTDNIPRVLPKHLGVRIDLAKVTVLPVFKWLAQQGGVNELELLRTFNCGIGMIAVVRSEAVHQVMDVLTAAGETATLLGKVIEASGDRVVYDNHLDLAT